MQVGGRGCSKVGFCGTVGLGAQSLVECKPWLWDWRGTGHWHNPRSRNVIALLSGDVLATLRLGWAEHRLVGIKECTGWSGIKECTGWSHCPVRGP